jgi:predicted DNA-binding transcriptional regulator AlpA
MNSISVEATVEKHSLISKPQLQTRLGGVSDTTIWRMWSRGELPKPVRVSKNRSMWLESEIDDWISKLASNRAA